jgi:hypothetical protein
MKLKKVLISYEILMNEDEDLGDLTLAQIHRECMDGDWSGQGPGIMDVKILTGSACNAACMAHGTDIEFFFPEGE